MFLLVSTSLSLLMCSGKYSLPHLEKRASVLCGADKAHVTAEQTGSNEQLSSSEVGNEICG